MPRQELQELLRSAEGPVGKVIVLGSGFVLFLLGGGISKRRVRVPPF